MAYQFRNLVFEGGGVKGIAYVGAMDVLQKNGVLKNIQRVGGTSAGGSFAPSMIAPMNAPSTVATKVTPSPMRTMTGTRSAPNGGSTLAYQPVAQSSKVGAPKRSNAPRVSFRR